jgi:hypothetical protein
MTTADEESTASTAESPAGKRTEGGEVEVADRDGLLVAEDTPEPGATPLIRADPLAVTRPPGLRSV